MRAARRVLILLFPLGLAVLVCLAPLPKLFTLEVYRGPQDLLRDQRALFNLYNATVTVLALLYTVMVVAADLRSFHARLQVGLFAVMLVVATAGYPIVYDPLFYHYTAELWVQHGVNVYTELVDGYRAFPFPVVKIPIPHNYAYGPLWLLVTALLFLLGGGHFVTFLMLLKLLALGSLVAIFRMLKVWFRADVPLPELLFFCGYNPIVLILILNSGLQEPIVSLLMLASLYFAMRHNLFLAAILLGLTVGIKISAWPLAPLVGAWLLGRQRSPRAWLRGIGTIAVGALVVVIPLYLSFGFSPAYLSGIKQFAVRERESWASLSGSVILPLSHTGLSFDRDALRALLRTLLLALNLGLVALFSLRHLRGAAFETLVRNSWLVLLLSPFLSDVGVRTWYLLPPLLLAPLLGRTERRLTAVVIFLKVLGGVPFSYVMLAEGRSRFLFYTVGQYVGHLIPTLLLLAYLLLSTRPFWPLRTHPFTASSR